MKAVVVGAGISGVATAIGLAARGTEVQLVEKRKNVDALGSGITLIGPALRALEQLGVVDECVDQGYRIDTFATLDLNGELVSKFDLPSPEGSNLPGMLGMTRPTLHRHLLARAAALGVQIRTGTEPVSILERDAAVEVGFNDGTSSSFDLLVGADGVKSSVRKHLFGEVPLVFRGQACIRVVLPRLPEFTGEVQFQPAGNVFVGFTPTSETSMYMYISFPAEEAGWPSQEELLHLVRAMIEPFGGPMDRIRGTITNPDQLNLAKFHTVILPAPWSIGRTVIVGDAAHCPTPQLAAGAAMCLEDAVALAQELDDAHSVTEALTRFSNRRHTRCCYVVQTSSQLSYWQTYPGNPDTDHEGLTAAAFELLAGPF